MTDTTDTLRPEVRTAVLNLDASLHQRYGRNDWQIIRAELLRLTSYMRQTVLQYQQLGGECKAALERAERAEAELKTSRAAHAEAERLHLELCDKLGSEIGGRLKAEAELAALRARFAEAPFVSVRVDDDKHVSLGARSHPKDFAHLHCKHGRLAREDGDA